MKQSIYNPDTLPLLGNCIHGKIPEISITHRLGCDLCSGLVNVVVAYFEFGG
jgi:hypothetical protein